MTVSTAVALVIVVGDLGLMAVLWGVTSLVAGLMARRVEKATGSPAAVV